MFKVGFIGVGNMGGALASSVAKIDDVSSVFLANRSSEKAKVLKEKIGEKARISTNIEAAQECDFIFLGVKPNAISNVLSEISEVLSNRHKNGETFVLVSMAAGITLDKLNRFAGEIPTIRIMPNTPVSIGEGVTLMCNRGVEERFLDDFKTIMQKTGNAFELEEELMDAGTALSGCGPAFVYMFADAIASGGEKLGIDEQTSKELALSTIIGSSKLAYLHFDETLESLKSAVCSPGGATLKGVEVLDQASFATIVEDAIQAACKRSKELAEA